MPPDVCDLVSHASANNDVSDPAWDSNDQLLNLQRGQDFTDRTLRAWRTFLPRLTARPCFPTRAPWTDFAARSCVSARARRARLTPWPWLTARPGVSGLTFRACFTAGALWADLPLKALGTFRAQTADLSPEAGWPPLTLRPGRTLRAGGQFKTVDLISDNLSDLFIAWTATHKS